MILFHKIAQIVALLIFGLHSFGNTLLPRVHTASQQAHGKLKIRFYTQKFLHALLAKIGVTVSLRPPDIRDDVLGGDPAGEAAIETGRRWARDEPIIRASCEIDVFSTRTDARARGNSGRRGRGGHSTRVTKPRLLVT